MNYCSFFFSLYPIVIFIKQMDKYRNAEHRRKKVETGTAFRINMYFIKKFESGLQYASYILSHLLQITF